MLRVKVCIKFLRNIFNAKYFLSLVFDKQIVKYLCQVYAQAK